ncbi:MAG: hypothetical protein BMS9Abin37_2434 [Acidobacteriota bacterium]|nr:MAG: hypothetical protein BMS9Abin37_2434 [Acidobacteriota bacterium]
MLADDTTLKVCRHEQPALETVASYIVAEGETWAHPAVAAGGRLIVKEADSVSVWRVGSNVSADSSRGRAQTR